MPSPLLRRLTACAAPVVLCLGLSAHAFAAPAPLPVGGTKKADLLDYSSSTRPVIVGALAGDDTVIGSRYDDVLSGGAGDDRITGGPGADLVSGDAGNDTFVLTPGGLPGIPAASGLNLDQIAGFSGQGTTSGGEQDLVDLRLFGPGATLQFVRLGKLGALSLPTVQIYEVRAAGASGGFVTITMKKGSTKLGTGDVIAPPPVQENRVPVFGTGDRSGSVTQALTAGGIRTDSGTIPFTDADTTQAHSVTTSGVGTTNGTLTAQVTADSTGAGTVTWTYAVANEDLRPLGADDSPTESFSVTLSDGSASDTATVVVTKNGINDAPASATTFADVTVQATGSQTWTIPTGAFVDADGDPVTYSAGLSGGPLPSWLAFDPGTGTFTASPTRADVGSSTVVVTAADGHGGTGTASFTTTVTTAPNAAPQYGSGDLLGAVTQIAGTGDRIDDGTIPFTDLDTDQTHTVDVQPVGDVDGTLEADVTEDGGTGHVSWDYTVDNEALRHLGAGATATESFVVTLSDGTTSAQVTVSITQTGINDAPAVTTPLTDRSVDALVPSSWSVPADLFTDPDDGDTITRSAVTSGGDGLPGWLSFTDATGLFAGTPARSDAGTVTIEVIGSDAAAVASASFALTVNAPNAAPVATADIVTWSVPDHAPTDPTSDEFSTNVLANDTDADGDDLTASGGGIWKLAGDPMPAGTFSVAADGTLTMNSGSDPLGPVQQLREGETWPASLIYTVTDGEDSSSGSVEVAVVGGRDQTVPFGRIAAPDDELVDFNNPTPTLFDARGCYVNPEGIFLQYSWAAQSSITVPPDPAFIANKHVHLVSVPNNQWGFNSQASVKLTAIPSNGIPAMSQTVDFFVTDADGLPVPNHPSCGQQSGRPYAPDVVVDLGTAPTGGNVLPGVIEPDGQPVTGGGYGYVGDPSDPHGTYVVDANGSVTVTPDADNPLAPGEAWSGEVRYRAIDPDGHVGVGMMTLRVTG